MYNLGFRLSAILERVGMQTVSSSFWHGLSANKNLKRLPIYNSKYNSSTEVWGNHSPIIYKYLGTINLLIESVAETFPAIKCTCDSERGSKSPHSSSVNASAAKTSRELEFTPPWQSAWHWPVLEECLEKGLLPLGENIRKGWTRTVLSVKRRTRMKCQENGKWSSCCSMSKWQLVKHSQNHWSMKNRETSMQTGTFSSAGWVLMQS